MNKILWDIRCRLIIWLAGNSSVVINVHVEGATITIPDSPCLVKDLCYGEET